MAGSRCSTSHREAVKFPSQITLLCIGFTLKSSAVSGLHSQLGSPSRKRGPLPNILGCTWIRLWGPVHFHTTLCNQGDEITLIGQVWVCTTLTPPELELSDSSKPPGLNEGEGWSHRGGRGCLQEKTTAVPHWGGGASGGVFEVQKATACQVGQEACCRGRGTTEGWGMRWRGLGVGVGSQMAGVLLSTADGQP